MKQLGVLFTLTVEMGTSMVGGIVVGYYLDRALNTFPWLSGIFFLSGLVVGVKTAVFIVKKYKKIF
ncbi:MAG: F0F1 ATP synthase assembly protein I [Syntrophobacterales bacterium CG_4_8_14_3_um_filter_49_14]|nr:MAG: F0F1 ATP synthase assembly protein I [Syntrophobacterales bacterium CG23_combo_of_CG06-09_8_20_14_all_48_27]PJC75371.1 MAG: F0F1 ATP synthase assembly protein I [Syntrophobacterales bacterium CG_4_8_14_3_um_filter_49_14]